MRAVLPIGLALLVTTSSLSPSVHAEDSLYRELGGSAGIAAIVDDAAAHWMEDPRIATVFDNANMMRLRKHLADYICGLTGGPYHYKSQDMQRVHSGLGITRAQFNAVAEDLQDAMEREGTAYTTQNRLLALLAPMQRKIVSR